MKTAKNLKNIKQTTTKKKFATDKKRRIALGEAHVRLAEAMMKKAKPRTEDVVEHVIYRMTRDRQFLNNLAQTLEHVLDRTVYPVVLKTLSEHASGLIKALDYQNDVDARIFQEYMRESANHLVMTMVQQGFGKDFQELNEAVEHMLGSGKHTQTEPSGRSMSDEDSGDRTKADQHSMNDNEQTKVQPTMKSR